MSCCYCSKILFLPNMLSSIGALLGIFLQNFDFSSSNALIGKVKGRERWEKEISNDGDLKKIKL